MDNSTIIFIVTLVVAFVFLRWLISPIPQSVAGEFNLPDPDEAADENDRPRPQRRRGARAVNDSMIEVVQAIGPQLTTDQIRYSLERTGSVEATVEEYMANGALPSPPGEPSSVAPQEADIQRLKSSDSQTLLEKYDVSGRDEILNEDEPDVTGTWGKDKKERLNILQKRKENMIIRARQRMKESLSNDVVSDGLTIGKK